MKLQATGHGTVRQALDAIQRMRERYGNGPIVHIAHPEFVHPDHVGRFAELHVIADASSALWFPGPTTSAWSCSPSQARARLRPAGPRSGFLAWLRLGLVAPVAILQRLLEAMDHQGDHRFQIGLLDWLDQEAQNVLRLGSFDQIGIVEG